MRARRKIELMHELFGRSAGHSCGECANLVCSRYRGRILRKCSAYGLTHSEASDWVKRWEACGLFDREYTGTQVIEIAKRRGRHQSDTEVAAGQIGIMEHLSK